jgi:hypothetical protein
MPYDPTGSEEPLKRSTTSQRRDSQHATPEAAEPRLPHERDESSDSQREAASNTEMELARRDMAQGRQDTDRGTAADQAYQQQKQGAGGGDQSGAGVHKTDAGHGPGDRKSATSGDRA